MSSAASKACGYKFLSEPADGLKCLLKTLSTAAELQDESSKLDAKSVQKVADLDYGLKTFRINLCRARRNE